VTFGDAALLALAGASAGAVNAVAGGGSLISFSSLLAVGYSPLTANVTNSVGVLPGYLGGTVGYRRELRGQERRAGMLALTAATGAIGGAVLLITTPAAAFEAAAPVLILLSCGLLAVQPRLTRYAIAHDGGGARSRGLHLGQFAAALYGGYFAAGFGVLLLAVLGALLPDEDLHRINALKGALSLIVGAIAAATFALFGPVTWSAAAVMAPASYLGGYTGTGAARRLSPGVLRCATKPSTLTSKNSAMTIPSSRPLTPPLIDRAPSSSCRRAP
jgi:uncharacterized membrane protein YfcA